MRGKRKRKACVSEWRRQRSWHISLLVDQPRQHLIPDTLCSPNRRAMKARTETSEPSPSRQSYTCGWSKRCLLCWDNRFCSWRLWCSPPRSKRKCLWRVARRGCRRWWRTCSKWEQCYRWDGATTVAFARRVSGREHGLWHATVAANEAVGTPAKCQICGDSSR